MGERPDGRRWVPARNDRRAGQGRTLVIVLLGCIPPAAAAVPAWYGLSGHAWPAFSLGLLLAGLIATVSGLATIGWWLGVRRVRAVEAFRLMVGLAVLCWGTGELWSAVDAADGAVAYPATGDLIASLAAPIGLLGIIFLPRRSVSSIPGLRLVLDSVVVGAALTFLLWRAVLTASAAPLEQDLLGTGAFVLADCAVFAAVMLTAVRDIRSRIWPAAVGVLCHVIADLGVMLAAESGGARVDPWASMSLWCLGWPLIVLGVVRFQPTAAGSEGGQDQREATSTQVATLITFTALLAGALGGGQFDAGADARGSLLLALLIVPVMCLREVMNTHLRLKLTAGLRAQAFRDSLTGLPNRRALTTRIDELDGDDVPRVVLTLDLDGFKQVNDLLGHHAGDSLLMAVADALREHCPPQALIARIGGDEFAVLCPGDLSQGRELAERLRAAVAMALARLAPGVGISASVGVGKLVKQQSSTNRDQLVGLVESAAALRAAKESGRDAVLVYDGEVAEGRERRLLLEHRLRLAIARGTIITFGQPIVDLGTGRLTGFESLARWTDEVLGFVPPDEFIEVAEQTGMVVELGEHLLSQTLGAAKAAGVFAAGLTLSVNASPIQLRVPGFVELVRDQLVRHGIGPDQLIVEITEAILVTEGDPAVSTLAEIHALGIGLAIDDFGTGYSALGYLRRLPVQVIKIDKSLTSSLLSEPKTVAIVEGVARMAHRMGVRVVMEGIEDELEADSCRAVGADRGQGYLFGRPTPWDRAAELIAGMDARPALPAPSRSGGNDWT